MYYYDNYGWLTLKVLSGRGTDVVPPDLSVIPDGYAANWSGIEWLIIPYVLPALPDFVIPVTDFLLLFTSDERIAVRSSTHPAVQDWFAILQDVRMQSVHLGHPSLVQALGLLQQLGILATGRAEQIQAGQLPSG